MTQEDRKRLILDNSVTKLSLDDNRELGELLNEGIAHAEEERKQEPKVHTKTGDACSVYQNHVIIDECTVYDVFEEKFKSRHSDLSYLEFFLQIWPF